VDTPRTKPTARSRFWTSHSKPRPGGNSGALIYGPNATGARPIIRTSAHAIGFAYAPGEIIRRFSQTVIAVDTVSIMRHSSYTDFGDSLSSGATINPLFRPQTTFRLWLVQGKGSLDSGFLLSHLRPMPGPCSAEWKFSRPPKAMRAAQRPLWMVQNWSFEISTNSLLISSSALATSAIMPRSELHLQQLNAIDPNFSLWG